MPTNEDAGADAYEYGENDDINRNESIE